MADRTVPPDPVAPPPAVGGMVGSFRLLSKLGEGGMGVVFAAEDTRLGRKVALKLMRAEAAKEERPRKMFLREAKSAAAVGHDRIVTIYEAGEADGVPYIAMELLAGEPLDTFLDRTPIPPVEFTIAVGYQIAEGLHAAHTHPSKLIHRDVKPANVWLRGTIGRTKPDVRLLDFGLSRSAGGDTLSSANVSKALGTPAYMAPEQWTGAGVDHQSDLFSIGVILYEMATGERPFGGSSVHQLMYQVTTASIAARDPREVNPAVPPRLADLILRLLVKDKSDRVMTAAQVVTLLRVVADENKPGSRPVVELKKKRPPDAMLDESQESVVTDPAVLTRPVVVGGWDIPEETPQPPKRTPTDTGSEPKRPDPASADQGPQSRLPRPEIKTGLWVLIASAVMGAIVCFALWMSHRSQSERSPISSLPPSDLSVPPIVTKPVEKKPAEPEPPSLIVPKPEEQEQVEPKPITGELLISLGLRGSPFVSVSFSPNGRRVVTVSGDKSAWVYDVTSRQPVSTFLKHTDKVVSAVFSPDSERVVTASWDKTARVWDATTGMSVTPPLEHAREIRSAVFSPNGRRVATASNDKTARVWDATTGQPVTPPLEHAGYVYSAVFSPDGRRVATASNDKTARVWNAATGQSVTPPLKHAGGVKSASFSLDGERVATASEDWTARVWDATTGQPVTPPLEHADMIASVVFSPDGRRVATASADRTARVWDTTTGRSVTPPLLHHAIVEAAAFSPDGRRVATASNNKEVRVWDAATGRPVTPPLPHTGKVLSASFDKYGWRLITTCDDGTVSIWPIPQPPSK